MGTLYIHQLNTYFNESFGGKRGFLRHIKHIIKYKLGFYRKSKKLDLNSVKRLVFVCKGNICRSAYAEYRSRAEGVPAISAGVDTTSGCSANPITIRTGKLLGLDLSNHKTSCFADITITKDDLILAMEPEHKSYLIKNFNICPEQILLLGIFSQPKRPMIQDPFMRNDAYHLKCYSIIDNAISKLKEVLSNPLETVHPHL